MKIQLLWPSQISARNYVLIPSLLALLRVIIFIVSIDACKSDGQVLPQIWREKKPSGWIPGDHVNSVPSGCLDFSLGLQVSWRCIQDLTIHINHLNFFFYIYYIYFKTCWCHFFILLCYYPYELWNISAFHSSKGAVTKGWCFLCFVAHLSALLHRLGQNEQSHFIKGNRVNGTSNVLMEVQKHEDNNTMHKWG